MFSQVLGTDGRRIAWVAGVLVSIMGVFGASPVEADDQGRGRVLCKVLENGRDASGTIVLKRGNETVARGDCKEPFEVPAGAYLAEIQLDGALDRPKQSRPITVTAFSTAQIKVTFSTGTLEVRLRAEGRAAAAMATIERDGKRVGTVACGVPAHLSAGRYVVIVRYRGAEKRFENVVIRGSDKTEITAEL